MPRLKTPPIATVFFMVAAVLVAAVPPSHAFLRYDRPCIAGGEWWRLVTGHFVHAGFPHLFWNLMLLLGLGMWAESVRPKGARIVLIASLPAIGIALLFLVPELETYVGLSGVVSAVAAFLGVVLIRRGQVDRMMGVALLVLMAVKSVVEMNFDQSLFAGFPDPEMRVVPLAHLVGCGFGLVVGILGRRAEPTVI